MTPAATVRERVLAQAAANPSPTRRQGRRAGAAVIVGSIGLAALAFALAGGFTHAEGRPLALTLALAGGWALAAAASTVLAMGRGGSTLPRRPAVLLTVAALSPVAVLVWMHLFYGLYEEPFQRFGWRCLGLTLGIAAAPLAGFLALRRGIEPRRRGAAALGAAAGATCGGWAGVVVDLWCPLTNPSHALVGHALPLVVLVALGALIGRRVLDVRRPGVG